MARQACWDSIEPVKAHPDHPEMIGVPVHSQLELRDADGRFKVYLRFRIYERISFDRHD